MLLIAEYALNATQHAAIPHVMAAFTRAVLDAHSRDTEANIRCLLGPKSIKHAAKSAANWEVAEETFVIPNEGVQDGQWEVSTIVSSRFLMEIDNSITEETLKAALCSLRDAVIEAVGRLGAGKVRTMDVWVARFH
jgi:hypothetical protein